MEKTIINVSIAIHLCSHKSGANKTLPSSTIDAINTFITEAASMSKTSVEFPIQNEFRKDALAKLKAAGYMCDLVWDDKQRGEGCRIVIKWPSKPETSAEMSARRSLNKGNQ